ncbi:DNA topoisomerase I [Oenococcus oeni]|uniref:type I DNA topoisomerase n=1 Tax=Oenococcus oeni TaxID=1247 RepID=UPI001077634E|nr:type I DNA topoisomerase [Oenococcus oeni]AVI94215.1 DNA topoisomerase I [Oenococcus oeni]SYW00144.1 DNA topoisomerase I [Oenococcus oeni]SYW02711.1 DNA topoisomerase I [Oenococcus oeni]SYW04340.1 DNA topoisomerase I [Oenococcus oeni]SYW17519.1 DNA topoisomerase I [Oenococcus oeni]
MVTKKKKAKKLVIVESPAKARTIENYLGKDYEVLASMGHIRDLPKSQLGVDTEHNYEPKYINIRGKAPLINSLKKAAKSASAVYVASDPDREGEAIAWHLGHILGLPDGGKNRVTFNEITKPAVKEAFKHPRGIEQDLVDAQQARRVLDRLVGYSISPILWQKVKRGLSAGRVQSVALGLILDKEKEIAAFVPKEYWSLNANFKAGKHEFSAEFYGTDGKKVKLDNQKSVSKILKRIDSSKDFKITDISTKESKRNAPNPFTTSSLQQTANSQLNYHARKTMQIAQGLYEGISLPKIGHVGLITYMRTDSTRLSETAQEMAKKFIVDKFGKEYYHRHNVVKKSENVQDAHEAIRPTDAERTPESLKEILTRDQYRLYNLIWSRFIASQMSEQKLENQSLMIEQNKTVWRATGIKVLFEGWTKALKTSSTKNNILPALKIGDLVQMVNNLPEQHFTQPPARYTEASLIKALEELGVGRPSTYAPTMDTIQRRGYIGFDQKKIVPTDLGDIVQDVVVKSFPEVTDKQFTSKIEDELDKVETGNVKWQKVIDEFYKPFSKEVDAAIENLEKVPIYDRIAPELCDICGSLMVIRRSRRGEFYACSRFPDCHGTKSIVEEIGMKCPKCGIGEVVIKRTKRGRIFYGCSRYPDCDFASWTKPKKNEETEENNETK